MCVIGYSYTKCIVLCIWINKYSIKYSIPISIDKINSDDKSTEKLVLVFTFSFNYRNNSIG